MFDNRYSPSARSRIIFFGMPTRFSSVHLERLIAAGEHIVGVIMPAGNDSAAATQPASGMGFTSISMLTYGYNIPLRHLRSTRDRETTTWLRTKRPDLAIVAGFPYRIPPAWLEIPLEGFINVHPSLLPAHRGPAPLFWTVRAGETETGVSLHYMDENFDTGDIIYQTAVTLNIGDSGLAHTLRLAEAGSELACLAARRYREAGSLPRRPQPTGGSHESAPGVQDFQISTDWPAERAFYFMRGTAGRLQPYALLLGDMLRLDVREALSYEVEGKLGAPYVRDGETMLVQFAPGVLRVRR